MQRMPTKIKTSQDNHRQNISIFSKVEIGCESSIVPIERPWQIGSNFLRCRHNELWCLVCELRSFRQSSVSSFAVFVFSTFYWNQCQEQVFQSRFLIVYLPWTNYLINLQIINLQADWIMRWMINLGINSSSLHRFHFIIYDVIWISRKRSTAHESA